MPKTRINPEVQAAAATLGITQRPPLGSNRCRFLFNIGNSASLGILYALVHTHVKLLTL